MECVFTILFQLAIAIIPCALQNDWGILLVTVTGTSLALTGGSLSQWRKDQWGARLDNKKTSYCLTRGNGLQHVVVIHNQSHGCLNLKDLAVPQRESCSRNCKVIIAFSALFWILYPDQCRWSQTKYLVSAGRWIRRNGSKREGCGHSTSLRCDGDVARIGGKDPKSQSDAIIDGYRASIPLGRRYSSERVLPRRNERRGTEVLEY